MQITTPQKQTTIINIKRQKGKGKTQCHTLNVMKAFHEKCDDIVDCNSQGLNSRTRGFEKQAHCNPMKFKMQQQNLKCNKGT